MCRDERYDGGAVGDAEKADLGAVEVLLDDDPTAGGRVRKCGLAVIGDDDTLAGGQAVVLDDVRRAECVESCSDFLRCLADVRHGCWYVGGSHDFFGERLRALELGSSGGRAEMRSPSAHGIGGTSNERHFRPDHHEVHCLRYRQRRDGVGVAGVDSDIGGEGCSSRVAGGAHEPFDVGVEAQRPAEGVLTGTGSNDEDIHDGDPIPGA